MIPFEIWQMTRSISPVTDGECIRSKYCSSYLNTQLQQLKVKPFFVFTYILPSFSSSIPLCPCSLLRPLKYNNPIIISSHFSLIYIGRSCVSYKVCSSYKVNSHNYLLTVWVSHRFFSYKCVLSIVYFFCTQNSEPNYLLVRPIIILPIIHIIHSSNCYISSNTHTHVHTWSYAILLY